MDLPIKNGDFTIWAVCQNPCCTPVLFTSSHSWVKMDVNNPLKMLLYNSYWSIAISWFPHTQIIIPNSSRFDPLSPQQTPTRLVMKNAKRLRASGATRAVAGRYDPLGGTSREGVRPGVTFLQVTEKSHWKLIQKTRGMVKLLRHGISELMGCSPSQFCNIPSQNIITDSAKFAALQVSSPWTGGSGMWDIQCNRLTCHARGAWRYDAI